MSEEKTQVADINTSRYDFKYEESDKDFYMVDKGLDEELVLRISEEKKDPEWVKELRLKLYDQLVAQKDRFAGNEWMKRQLLEGKKL